MSMLGKILAFLNILGVGGFISLAALTYAKRQTWEYANFRNDLIVEGLPIDDADSDRTGNPLVNRFGSDADARKTDHTLKELFPANPVATQVAEVERVRAELQKKIDEAGSDVRKQNMLYAQLLLPLAGSHTRTEIYADREFYLSMKAQLEDDKQFEAFKKVLADAIVMAVESVRFEPKKQSFEKAFQQVLTELPGEDKWKLAEAFLKKLPKEGVPFERAAEAGKAAAEDVEKIGKAKEDATQAVSAASSAYFVARAEYRASPTPEKKADMEKLDEALRVAAKKEQVATEALKLAPPSRDAAAVAFLETIRQGKKNDKSNADYIKGVVNEVLTETLDDVRDVLSARFEQTYKEALSGDYTAPEKGDSKLIRDRRRLAIARVLIGAIDILDPEAVKSLQDGSIGMDLPSYKRLIAVVGIESAVRAVNEQQKALEEVVGTLNDRIAAERTSFRDRHHDAILSLRRRAEEIDRLGRRLVEIAAQADKQRLIASGELARVDQYVVDLKESRDKTAAEMTELVRLTDGLNKVRITIRDAIRSNEVNLRKITELEDEVLYLQRKVEEKEKADKEKKRQKTP